MIDARLPHYCMRYGTVTLASARGWSCSPEHFFRQSKRFQDTWNRVVHAISRMRADRVSLQRAAREFGVSPREAGRIGAAQESEWTLRSKGKGQSAPRDESSGQERLT